MCIYIYTCIYIYIYIYIAEEAPEVQRGKTPAAHGAAASCCRMHPSSGADPRTEETECSFSRFLFEPWLGAFTLPSLAMIVIISFDFGLSYVI